MAADRGRPGSIDGTVICPRLKLLHTSTVTVFLCVFENEREIKQKKKR